MDKYGFKESEYTQLLRIEKNENCGLRALFTNIAYSDKHDVYLLGVPRLETDGNLCSRFALTRPQIEKRIKNIENNKGIADVSSKALDALILKEQDVCSKPQKSCDI